MKKAYFLSVFIWCLLALVACGKKDEGPHYYEIRVESEQLEELERGQFLLGQQYYQGEPVSIISQPAANQEKGAAIDVYIRPLGGEMQLLMSGVSMNYRTSGWYLDEKGNCFIIGPTAITRLDADGEMLYKSNTEGFAQDICGLEDGRIILLTKKDTICIFWELDPDTGEIAQIDDASLEDGTAYIGAWGKNLMLLDPKGFWQVDLKTGTKELKLPFAGTFFTLDRDAGLPVDFWVDGSEAGILWSTGMVERLERADITGKKELITVRGDFGSIITYLKEQMNLFNQSNNSYYVIVEEPGEGVDRSDFHTETNLKLASGKGADIICSNAVDSDVSGLIEKGVFADLAPLMEASGLREEDYFPAAFDSWRDGDKIYGIVPDVSLRGYKLDKEVLNGKEELTIEILVDSLLEFEGDWCFFSDGEWIMNYFLQGSEDLWGMVDWEEGTCDFSGELFSKMLCAAKRYAYDERHPYPTDERHPYPTMVLLRSCVNLYNFDTTEELEEANQVDMGVFFDDGHHTEVNLGTCVAMGINAESEHVEGAWEFLAFLLGEESQVQVKGYGDWAFPVSRDAFDRLAQEELEYGITWEYEDEDGKVYTYFTPGRYHEDLVTEDMVEEMRQILSETKSVPYKVKPLIAIIKEEAAYYFNDAKDMNQVISTIQNRVQLYLDEHKAG